MEVQQGASSRAHQPLEELTAEALRQMQEAGYSASVRQSYGSVWRALKRFAHQVEGTDQFSVGLAERFLAHKGYRPDACPDTVSRSLRRYLSSLRLLVGFHATGRIRTKRSAHRRLPLPTHFQEVLAEYERECRLAGHRPATLKNWRQHLPTLLLFLNRAGVEHLSEVRPAHISDFLVGQGYHASSTMGVISSAVRCFLRFLQQRGILQEDVAATVPSVPRRTYSRIPSVWTEEEVERLLAQVDRGSPQGKRDYAILLLAARLGMRVGDIVRLCLEHLRWEERRIELTQSKTRQPLVLPLTEEVGWALIDYLRHGRPAVSHREVFLRCAAPFGPLAHNDDLHYIISKYRRQASIFFPTGRPRGLHSLRHSLASRLLSSDVPLATIADVLGHANSESARVYTKVDLPHLRACAIDPEESHHA